MFLYTLRRARYLFLTNWSKIIVQTQLDNIKRKIVTIIYVNDITPYFCIDIYLFIYFMFCDKLGVIELLSSTTAYTRKGSSVNLNRKGANDCICSSL